MLPALFISHGSPMTVLLDSPARDFMRGFGAGFDKPKAILAVSAHWETAEPLLGGPKQPETIHDFYGFPQALYQIHYDAPGAPELAASIAKRLDEAGFKAGVDPRRGLDHGAWTPLYMAYPKADIPVLQLSIQSHLDPAHHHALGVALRPLREEGVLILATGSMTHNLRELDRNVHGDGRGGSSFPWAQNFADWMEQKLEQRDDAALLDYRAQAPEARRNHPTDEHLLPLYVALGAATPGQPAKPLHRSMQFGSLSMDSYRFD